MGAWQENKSQGEAPENLAGAGGGAVGNTVIFEKPEKGTSRPGKGVGWGTQAIKDGKRNCGLPE